MDVTIAAIVVLVILIVVAAVHDVRSYRIPNWISLAIAVAWIGYVASLNGPTPKPDVWTSLLIGAVVFFVGAMLFLTGKFGGGDVKMLTAVSLWAGPSLIAEFLTATALAGGLQAGVIYVMAKYRGYATPGSPTHGAENTAASPIRLTIPYGVAIAAGGAIIAGQLILNAFKQYSP